VTYVGLHPLSNENAFSTELVLDGVKFKGKVFYQDGHNMQVMPGRKIEGGMEQPYDYSSYYLITI
jgi:hypothetical protein